MLDFELAQIYGHETRYFNRQVKNNMERFDNEFGFQLTKDEFNGILKCENFTSSWGGSRKLPYAFTEQGIYMLMTMLKGELAIKQSKILIKTFKRMKDYIVENGELPITNETIKSTNLVNEHSKRLSGVEEKSGIVMHIFIDSSTYKHYLILNGEKIEADAAFTNMFSLANRTLYLVDDYIGLKTLELLKFREQSIKIIIFADNVARPKSASSFVDDFKNDRPDINISFKRTNNRTHGRYIAIDINDSFGLFHSGASSKDGGNKITTIMEIEEPLKYVGLFDELPKNEELVIE